MPAKMVLRALGLLALAGLTAAIVNPTQVFPSVFSLGMNIVSPNEGTDNDDPMLYDVEMAVDTPNNLMVMQVHLTSTDFGGDARVIFNLTAREMYWIDYQDESCETEPIGISSGQLFGLAQWNPWIWLYMMKMNEARLPTPAEIRAFIESKSFFNDKSMAMDEIPVKRYNFDFRISDISYFYKDNILDQRLKMHYMWSDPSSGHVWSDGNDWSGNSFPVETKIDVYNSDSPHVVSKTMHILFHSARENYTVAEMFTIPDHVFCERRVKATIPSWPMAYHFEAEVAVPATDPFFQSETDGFLFYTHEYYDTIRSLSAAVYQDQDLANDSSTSATMYGITDHTTKMTFQYNTRTEECMTGPLFLMQWGSLNDAWDLARLHLSDPISFFDLSHEYSRDGQRSVRGVSTDKFITQRKDWPDTLLKFKGINITSVWEWFISRGDWVADEIFDRETGIPIKLDITLNIVDNDDTVNPFHGTLSYNLFNFHKDEGVFSQEFNMAPCMAAAGIANQSFTLNLNQSLNGPWKAAMASPALRAKLSGAVHDAAFRSSGVESRLRISVDYLDPMKASARVSVMDPFNYTLLQPPFDKPVVAVPTAAVLANWTQSLASNQFQVLIPMSLDMVDVVMCAVSGYSAWTPTPPTSSSGSDYSGGAFAGFGVGMLLLGLILGALVVMLVANFAPGKPLGDSNFIRFVNKD